MDKHAIFIFQGVIRMILSIVLKSVKRYNTGSGIKNKAFFATKVDGQYAMRSLS
jgi:hypothetical protein